MSRSSTTWTKSEAAQASVKARMAESPLRGPGHPRIGRQAAAGIAPLESNAPKPRRKPRPSVTSPGGIDRSSIPLSTLKARVRVRGLQAIDRRTLAARHLLDWKEHLLADLGGESHATAAQIALVEIATRTRLFFDHVDAILLALPALVNRRRKLLPLVEQRQRLADSLVRTLSTLGLERRARGLDLVRALATPHREPDASDEATSSAPGALGDEGLPDGDSRV